MASTTSLGVTLTVLLAVITPSAVLPLYHHRHHGAPGVVLLVEAQPLPVSYYSNGKGEPKYTSSPLPEALKAMPYACDDDCVSKLRFKAWEMQGNCTTCAFAWPATTTVMANTTTSDIMGIVLYNGAFVDPRSYSVLASKLASRGVNVIVPVFPNDLATDCNGMTLEAVTNAFFPNVTAWMVAGHSYGGVGASYAAASTLLCGGTSPRVVALGVIGSYIKELLQQCPETIPVPNFEEDDHLHAAVITGNRDLTINLTNFVDNLNRLPVHTTFTSIIGGNHQQFGSYDPSGRPPLYIDGNATISRDAQLNATADALVRTLLRATKNNDISPRSLVDC